MDQCNRRLTASGQCEYGQGTQMTDDDTQEEGEMDGQDSGVIKDLRKKADRTSAAEAEAAAAKRELLFVRAGIDVDSKLGALIFKSYDGELTADAVKAYAGEIPGAIGTPEPSGRKVEITQDERDLAGDRAALGGSVQDPATPEGEDPTTLGLRQFQGRMQMGHERDKASGELFDRLFDAAARGDERVIYDPDRYTAKYGQ